MAITKTKAAKPQVFSIVSPWKRIILTGCSHGHLRHKDISGQVLAFKKRFQPDIAVDLGDLIDTAAFRGGAVGTQDEYEPIDPDKNAAVDWIEQYQPTHITWGNHDWRLVELMHARQAVVAHAAGSVWQSIQNAVREVGAVTRPYTRNGNWFRFGDTHAGHGFWFGEHCVRDHAEFLGTPVVMAHKHVAQEVYARTRFPGKSFCVGMLGDPEKFGYADRRRATSQWSHGVVAGEVAETKDGGKSNLWLVSCAQGQSLIFPDESATRCLPMPKRLAS